MNNNVKLLIASSLAHAVNNLSRGLENCGLLTSEQAKQSDENKEYFRKMAEDYKEAIDFIKNLDIKIKND